MIDTKELRAVIQKIGLNGVCPAVMPRLWSRHPRDADARADRRALRPLRAPERAESDACAVRVASVED